MNQEECIFCKIISGDLPSEKVYEDDTVLCILDIRPVNHGHVLILPKNHHLNMLDAEDDLSRHLVKVAKRIGHAVMEATSATGFNMGVNNGASAGQIIFHEHWHVIPRFENDNLSSWSRSEYKEGEKEVVGEQVRSALKEHLPFGKIHDAKHPWPVVDGILVNDKGEVLMTKRTIEPVGTWCIPGGHIDWGETPQAAVVREFKEETGLDVEIVGIFNVYGERNRDPRKHTISTVFKVKKVGGELKLNDEVDEFKWFAEKDLPKDICSFDHYEIVKDFFKDKNEGSKNKN